jgi:DNA-binding HxlR family transcriptional regulator/putative sterol carrier protein
MTINRSYGDACGVARSLDVIGERWALLIVRELLLGPKRFNDLLAGLADASPNVISQRLRELAGHGVIRQRDLGPPARVRVYELTEWGRELEPVVLHLAWWGIRSSAPYGSQVSPDSLMLVIKAFADPAQVGGLYELRIGADTFTVDAPDGTIQIRRGTPGQPDAILTADAGVLSAVVFGQRPVADAVQSGDLRLDGDPEAASQLADLLTSLAPDPEPQRVRSAPA